MANVWPTELVREHADLTTLAQCAAWVGVARASVEGWQGYRQELQSWINQAVEGLAEADKAAASRPWWKRLWPTREQKAARVEVSRRRKAVEAEEQAKEGLGHMLVMTPTSDGERRALIAELRRGRKELVAQKSEVGLAMREVRSEARRKSAVAGVTQAVTGMKGYAAAERKSIAITREHAVAPLEARKMELEARILQIDREVLRLERL